MEEFNGALSELFCYKKTLYESLKNGDRFDAAVELLKSIEYKNYYEYLPNVVWLMHAVAVNYHKQRKDKVNANTLLLKAKKIIENDLKINDDTPKNEVAKTLLNTGEFDLFRTYLGILYHLGRMALESDNESAIDYAKKLFKRVNYIGSGYQSFYDVLSHRSGLSAIETDQMRTSKPADDTRIRELIDYYFRLKEYNLLSYITDGTIEQTEEYIPPSIFLCKDFQHRYYCCQKIFKLLAYGIMVTADDNSQYYVQMFKNTMPNCKFLYEIRNEDKKCELLNAIGYVFLAIYNKYRFVDMVGIDGTVRKYLPDEICSLDPDDIVNALFSYTILTKNVISQKIREDAYFGICVWKKQHSGLTATRFSKESLSWFDLELIGV